MKAVLKNGLIHPQEPVPQDWTDGTELHVEKSALGHAETNDDLDQWMAKVQACANRMDPEDEVILEKSIREIRQQARDLARKEAEKS
jgi:gluconate kinase